MQASDLQRKLIKKTRHGSSRPARLEASNRSAYTHVHYNGTNALASYFILYDPSILSRQRSNLKIVSIDNLNLT